MGAIEPQQLLRYGLPGFMIEVTIGLWLHIAYFVVNPESQIALLIPGDQLVILVGLAIPGGFLLSVIAHQASWTPWLTWLIRPLDPYAALPSLRSGVGTAPAKSLSREYVSAIVDAELHIRNGTIGEPPIRRARSLLDLMNGLGTALMGVTLGALAVGILAVLQLWKGDISGCEAAVSTTLWAMAIAPIWWVFWLGQHRVSRLSEHFLSHLLAQRR